MSTARLAAAVAGAVLLVPMISPAADVPAVKLTPKEIRAVDAFITTQARARRSKETPDRCVEDPDARRYLVGDVAHDRVPDIVVRYTLEQGNNWTLFLAVFTRPSMRPVASARVGGKGYRTVDLGEISHGVIELHTQSYAPNDPMCCPSVPGQSTYGLVQGRLEEIELTIDCSARNPPEQTE